MLTVPRIPLSAGALIENGQVSKCVSSYIGNNKYFEKKFLDGVVGLELTPQGSLAERVRAGAFGIPAFYTPTGQGTLVQEGGLPIRFAKRDPNSKDPPKVIQESQPREERTFNGKKFILEEAIKADVGLIHAWKADEQGNLVFRYTAANFSAPMAKNAKLTIVEAEEIVPTGSLEPNSIHVPSVYVNRVVKATQPKMIEKVMLAKEPSSGGETTQSESQSHREVIAKRAAKEFQNGDYVNLGVGLPTLAPNFVPEGVSIVLQSENGILGMGPYPTEPLVDADIVNAGKETVMLNPGAATFDSSESFGMIRGGHIDVTMLGALQIGANGDLANYYIPGKVVKGMGGAMDLVSSPESTRVIVLSEHVDKYGKPKIVKSCSLPLTGARVASRIITNLAVFDVDRASPEGGLTLVELQPGATLEEVKEKTGAPFKVALKE